MDSEKIGAYICKLRQDKKFTQKDLADKIGVTDKAISKWECGKGLPDITLLEPLATALDTSVAELLSGESIAADCSVEQTDKAIVQALEHYKGAQRLTAGIWLLILGVCLLLVSVLSIAGKWFFQAFALGIASVVIGIILMLTKNSLVSYKIPKAVAQWISFGALAVTIVLEALPYGVVTIFATGPEEYERIVRLYSYFDFLPFGYGDFAPLITAMLTVSLTVLAFVLIFVKRPLQRLRKTQFVATAIASAISVCPVFYGYEYVTIIGVFVTLLLAASAVFCAIANENNAKENETAAKTVTE